MKTMLCSFAVAALSFGAVLLVPSPSKAFWNNDCCTPETYFAHPAYGQPLTTLLAPCVHRQINYQWGVPGVRVDRVPWRFEPGAPDYAVSGSTMYPPYWPTSTTQLGTYYMRVPW